MVQEKSVKIGKEIDDCCSAILLLVTNIKAKKPIGEIITAEIPALITAIEGINQVKEEAQDKEALANTAALFAANVISVFTK